jgi:hypothetical protein
MSAASNSVTVLKQVGNVQSDGKNEGGSGVLACNHIIFKIIGKQLHFEVRFSDHLKY